jgi:hypothetical protein
MITLIIANNPSAFVFMCMCMCMCDCECELWIPGKLFIVQTSHKFFQLKNSVCFSGRQDLIPRVLENI